MKIQLPSKFYDNKNGKKNNMKIEIEKLSRALFRKSIADWSTNLLQNALASTAAIVYRIRILYENLIKPNENHSKTKK